MGYKNILSAWKTLRRIAQAAEEGANIMTMEVPPIAETAQMEEPTAATENHLKMLRVVACRQAAQAANMAVAMATMSGMVRRRTLFSMAVEAVEQMHIVPAPQIFMAPAGLVIKV